MKRFLAISVLFIMFVSAVSAQPPMDTRPSKYYGSVEFDGGGTVDSGTVLAVADGKTRGQTEFSGGTYELVVERNSSDEDSFSSVSFVAIYDGEEISTGQSAEFREFGSQEVNLTFPEPASETDGGDDSGDGGDSFTGSLSGDTVSQEENSDPVVGFTWDTPVRPGEEVVLSATGSFDTDGNITDYRWSIGDTGSTASTVFDSAGSYPVTLTVEDDDGAISNITKEVVVTENSAPVPIFEITYSGENILTDVEFDASDSYDPDGSIETYSWSFGERGVSTVNSFEQPQNVTLTVSDNEGKVASVTKQLNQPVDQEDSSTSSEEGNLTGSFTASQTGVVVGFALVLLVVGVILIKKNSISIKVLRSDED